MSTIRFFRTLIAVADCGSFAAAADRVALTPAAVGAQMKALEDELKRPLFDRSRRGVVFTPAGAALVPRARRLVQDYEALVTGDHADGDIAGTVTIGAILSAMGALAISVVELKRRYPALDLRIVYGRQAELQSMVLEGAIDAAIIVETPSPRPTQAAWKRLYAEPLMLVASSKVASRNAEPAQLLRSQPFIRFERSSITGAKIDRILRRYAVQPNEIVEMNSLSSIVDLIRQGAGVSIVPVLRNFDWEHDKALRLLPIPGKRLERHVGWLECSARPHITAIVREQFLRTIER